MTYYTDVADSDPKIKQVIGEVESFVKWIFRHYGEPRKIRSGKVIHDAVWGTCRFEQHLISLIDTPLIQRLRYIHQTGNTHLIYPSTKHSRFEHTLGVATNVSRIIHALQTKFKSTETLESKNGYLDEGLLRTLRLSAILHDCGHGPFSHTSEEVYSRYEEIKYLKRFDPFKSASSHEILSYLIINTETFKNFFDLLSSQYNLVVNYDLLGDAIVGHVRDKSKQYQIDILNGPFDGDKIDYLYRDGHFSGLPLTIDLDRLWYSVDINEVEERIGTDIVEKRRRLTIDFSGMSCLEQILFSKMMLFPSVYQHHKVRACDCMFKGIIELIKDGKVKLVRKIDGGEINLDLGRAVHFLYLTDNDFTSYSLADDNDSLHRILHNLQYRRLLKRAVVISKDTIDDSSNDNYDEFKNYSTNPVTKEYKGRIYDYYRYVAYLIYEKAGKPGLFEDVWVDMPIDPLFNEANKTFISPLGEGVKPKEMTEFFQAHKYAEQYKIRKWRGHVFCHSDYIDRISEASVQVFREHFGIEFNDLAFQLCHRQKPSRPV